MTNRTDLAHRTVRANGIRFHLAEAGEGPPVLLLHGFGQHWRSWRHQLHSLADGYRVIAVDLRGCGDSDKPPRGYDAFTLADDVAGIVRALGERTAAVVGAGHGGTLAFNTAILHPELVTGMVAISAPHPGRMARFRRPVRTDPYGRLLAFCGAPIAPHRRLAAGHGALLERMVRAQAGPAWKASADFAEQIAALRAAISKPGAARGAVEPLRWVARSPWRADGRRHREALERPLTAPVLHLVGDGDRFTPRLAIADAAEQCGGDYQLTSIPGAGHYPAEEAPGAVNALLRQFLAGR